MQVLALTIIMRVKDYTERVLSIIFYQVQLVIIRGGQK